MRTRSEIEQNVALQRTKLDRARAELTEARGAYLSADEAYIDKGDKRTLERRRDTSDALERCEKLERRAVDAHEAALVELAQLQREELTAELEGLMVKLGQFGKTVETHGAEFVAIDRRVNDHVFALAVELRDAVADYDRAVAHGNELRLPGLSATLGPRPDLANVSLAVRRQVSAARKAEDRDPLAAHWLQDDPGASDWRLRGMNAAELAGAERAATSATREVEIGRAVLAGANAAARDLAARQAPKPEPKPNPISTETVQ